jgi:hypothetical protein
MFNASFPPQKRTKLRQNTKAWFTTGIKTSYNNKRKLYLLYRESNDPNLKYTIRIIAKYYLKLSYYPKKALQ